MCPGTLALVSTAATAGGAILGGVSAGSAASYQAQVARENAQISQQNAQRAAQATAYNTEKAGLEARARDAQVRVGAAAEGLDVNSGSPANVEASQRELGSLDTANTAEKGAEATYGYETQATSENAQAALDQSQVVPDYLGGFLKAGGSIAGSASNLPSGNGSGIGSEGDWSGIDGSSSLMSGEPGLPSSHAWMGGNSFQYAGPDSGADILDG